MPEEYILNTAKTISEQAWINELLAADLTDKSLNRLMDRLLKTLQHSPASSVDNLHEKFIDLFTPIHTHIDHFNPTDDLLYRCKYFQKKINNQYSTTLYTQLLHYRAIAMLRIDKKTRHLFTIDPKLLTRQKILESDETQKHYGKLSYAIDDAFNELYDLNQHNRQYHCNISHKIKVIIEIMQPCQKNLEAYFAYLKLGELLRTEFPYTLAENTKSILSVFSTQTDLYIINNQDALASQKEFLIDLMITNINNSTLQKILFGIHSIESILSFSSSPPPILSRRYFGEIAHRSTQYIMDDLCKTSPFRHQLDNAINDVGHYAKQKSKATATAYKGAIADSLTNNLRIIANAYFSNEDKNADLKGKFYTDCQLAIQAANQVLGEHRTPRWQRLIANFLLALSAVLTLGISVFARRHYSQNHTGYPTFFINQPAGQTRAQKVLDIITAEQKIENTRESVAEMTVVTGTRSLSSLN